MNTQQDTIITLTLLLICAICSIFIVNGLYEYNIKQTICKTTNTTIDDYDRCMEQDLTKEIIPNLSKIKDKEN